MLEVDQVHECKRLIGEGMSIRGVARQLCVSRNTVRRYVRDGKEPGRYEQSARRAQPVRDRIRGRVAALLDEEHRNGTPRKQRLTGTRMTEILRQEDGIACCETTVRRLVRELRHAQRDALEHAYLKLAYRPGRDAQVDFFEASVFEGGATEPVKRHFLVVRLCYSARLYVYAAPNQTREALLEGLSRAFVHFGGVPRVLWFDNLTPVVQKVLRGRDRKKQRGFEVFEAHHGFQSEFCRPARGNEKGGVENAVRHVHRRALSPIPRVADRESLQAHCGAFCASDDRRRVQGMTETIEQRFLRERGEFLKLPAMPFDPSTLATCKVTSKAWIQHGTNCYSVPVGLAGKSVDVRIDAERVRAFHGGELVAEHARRYGRGEYALQIEHYLPLLERKLRAVPHALVVHDWMAKHGQPWRTLLDVLQRQRGAYDGASDFVAERVTGAVVRALRQQEVSLATIRYFLGAEIEEARPRVSLPRRPLGPRVATGSLADYSAMQGVRHG